MTIMKIPLNKNLILSRCVKCNNPELQVITKEKAMETLKWENSDDREETTFYNCEGCKQIYWEGGMFKRAKENFESIERWEIEVIEKNEEIREEGGSSYMGIEGLSKEVYDKVREAIKEELRKELREEFLNEAVEKLKGMI